MMSHLTALVFVAVLVAPAASQRGDAPLADGEALADFDRRIKSYVAMRDKLEKGPAELDVTAKAEELTTAEEILAYRIRTARAGARRGEFFTPAISARFRQLLNPEMRGTRGANTRGIIDDEGPGEGGFKFRINGPYPKEQPLGTVPPNILSALPPLPDGIEYRFVDRHLILRDIPANLILDYIPNAIP